MDATVKAVRAIAVEFFLRLYKPVVIVVFSIFAVLIGINIWLVTISAWWWLLFAVVLLWLCIALLFFIISYLIVRAVRPVQTKQQKVALRTFVDKIEHLKDVTATPKFILLFRVVRDVFKPSGNGYIASLSGDATSLKKDFIEFQNSFRSQ